MRLIDADALEKEIEQAIALQKVITETLEIEDLDESVQAELKAYEDVLEGIKEQPTIHEKATEPKLSEHKTFGTNRVCGACGKYIFPAAKYCNECGRAVKWDEGEEEHPKVLRFSDMSFVMPIEDGETPEDIEDRVIEVMDTLRDNMVISYKTNIEELNDDLQGKYHIVTRGET